jgi:hypothetical protein
MEVSELTSEREGLYLQCLEDWSEEMKEDGNHNETWYAPMKDRELP